MASWFIDLKFTDLTRCFRESIVFQAWNSLLFWICDVGFKVSLTLIVVIISRMCVVLGLPLIKSKNFDNVDDYDECSCCCRRAILTVLLTTLFIVAANFFNLLSLRILISFMDEYLQFTAYCTFLEMQIHHDTIIVTWLRSL